MDKDQTTNLPGSDTRDMRDNDGWADDRSQPPGDDAQRGDLDAQRAERYQRYLRDLRAHEQSTDAAPEAAQTASRAQPPARANGRQRSWTAEPPQTPDEAPAPARAAPQPQQPPASQPAGQSASADRPDDLIEQTIERYMDNIRRQDSQPPAQTPPAQPASADSRYAPPPSGAHPGADGHEYAAAAAPAVAAPMSGQLYDEPPGAPGTTQAERYGAQAQRYGADDWRDDIDAEFDEHGGLYADDETSEPRKSKRAAFAVFGILLALAILGAGGVYGAYKYDLLGNLFADGEDKVPVVTADNSPAKVAPKDPGGVKIPQQTKLIYDRIVGDEIQVDEKIVPREEPVTAPAQTPVAPQSPASQPAPNQASPTQASPNGVLPLPPPPPAPDAPATQAQPAQPAQPSTARVVTPSAPTPDAEAPPDLPKVTIIPPGSEPPPPPAPETAQAAPPPPPPAPAQAAPAQVKPQPAPAPRRVARVQRPATPPRPSANAPIRLTPPSSPSATPGQVPARPGQVVARAPAAPVAPAAPRSPTPNGSYVVQTASLGSQAEADRAFARLKARHPNLLANYGPLIQQADVSGKTYYRLRVGPLADRSAAQTLCNALKSAGERACLVARR